MGLYAPISMIYWFPRLGSINTFKLALIALICFSTFLFNTGTKRTLSGVTAFAFLALLAILPSIGLSPLNDLVDYFTNVGIIATFCLAVSTFDANDHLYKILINLISFGVVSFALIHVIGSLYFNLDSYIPINEAYTGFADIGFNLSRTGFCSLGFCSYFILKVKSTRIVARNTHGPFTIHLWRKRWSTCERSCYTNHPLEETRKSTACFASFLCRCPYPD